MTNAIKCKMIICEGVQTEMTSSGVKNTIVNVLPLLEPMYIPSHFTFTASCQLSGDFKQVESSFITVKLIEPEGKVIATFDNIPIAELKHGLQTMPDNIMLNFEFRNVILTYTGEYSIKLHIGENLIHTETIEVRKRDLSDTNL